MSNNLKFKNGKFRILQLTDIQEICTVSPDTTELITAIINDTKPDFIIITGDQIKGYSPQFMGKYTEAKAMGVISKIMKPVVMSHIPFTVTFGNHDEFGDVSKDFQWNVYRLFDNFIGENYNADAYPVYSANGNKIEFCVYAFDTFAKNKDGSYSPITAEQIDFYRNKRDSLKEKTGHYVNSLAFQHVPPVEIYNLLKEVPKNTKGSVQGARSFSDKYYVLPDYSIKDGGFMHENAATPDIKSGQLEAFREKGDVLGLFFGHDHINSFVLHDNGFDMGYTQSCGFNEYGPGLKRGGRIFEIQENDTSRYSTRTVTYEDVIGKKLKRPLVNLLVSNMPSSVTVALKNAGKAGAVIAATASALFILKKITNHK